MLRLERIGRRTLAAAILVGLAALASAQSSDQLMDEFRVKLAAVGVIYGPIANSDTLATCIRTSHNAILRASVQPYAAINKKMEDAMMCSAAKAATSCAEQACKKDVRICADVPKWRESENGYCATAR
jgi:hypothetical protein